MNTYQLTLLTIFAVLGYLVATDETIAEYFNLVVLTVWIKVRKAYLLVKLHPFWIMNPLGRYLMMRKYRKMAESMLQSIKEQQSKEQ